MTDTRTVERVNLLDLLTEDLTLPDGCDRWGIRTTHPDLRSSRGHRWPFPGQWANAAGPFVTDNTDGCPDDDGDGICLAHSWRGMRSGGVSAVTLLLCAYNTADVLGETPDEQKIRVRRAYVVDVVDGTRLIRKHGTRVDLTGANLTRADLTRADLTGAYLTDAYLARANLARADLTGANLTRADLTGANLTGVDLTGAYLTRANLTRADLTDAYLTDAYLARADLTDANLTGVDLTRAYLTRANLTRANLTRAEYTSATQWPDGFNASERGAIQLDD